MKTAISESNTSPTITALVVEGSAMRSVFSAGLLDGFLQANFKPFDFYLGVSAGAYNLMAYLNGTPATSLRIFEQFATSRQFINLWRFLRGGHLIDLDWLERFAFDSQHINTQAVCRTEKPLYVGVTDVMEGVPVYIHVTPQNIYPVIKASAALPWFYRGFPQIDGRPMTDGGVSDSIPVAEAIRLGATRIMVIRARNKHYMKKDTPVHKYMRWKMRKFPLLHATLSRRIQLHQDSIALIRNPPEGVSIIEICPPSSFSIGRFNRNQQQLLEGYHLGQDAAPDAINQWMDSENEINREQQTS
jgi:predicted patatin/cPLA2 family phospholipase